MDTEVQESITLLERLREAGLGPITPEDALKFVLNCLVAAHWTDKLGGRLRIKIDDRKPLNPPAYILFVECEHLATRFNAAMKIVTTTTEGCETLQKTIGSFHIRALVAYNTDDVVKVDDVHNVANIREMLRLKLEKPKIEAEGLPVAGSEEVEISQ